MGRALVPVLRIADKVKAKELVQSEKHGRAAAHMNVQSQREIRWREIELARKHFNGSCYFCGNSIVTNRKRPKPHTIISFVGFAYHHTRYVQGEPRRKDYPKGSEGTWQYKKAVLPIVERYPEEFLLVDRGCHKILESVLIKYRKNPNFILKLDLGVRMTQTLTVTQRYQTLT